jgi:hypothetical protein
MHAAAACAAAKESFQILSKMSLQNCFAPTIFTAVFLPSSAIVGETPHLTILIFRRNKRDDLHFFFFFLESRKLLSVAISNDIKSNIRRLLRSLKKSKLASFWWFLRKTVILGGRTWSRNYKFPSSSPNHQTMYKVRQVWHVM